MALEARIIDLRLRCMQCLRDIQRSSRFRPRSLDIIVIVTKLYVRVRGDCNVERNADVVLPSRL